MEHKVKNFIFLTISIYHFEQFVAQQHNAQINKNFLTETLLILFLLR